MSTLPYETEGNKDSKNMVIFIHGWPDSISIWDETQKNLDLHNSYILKLSYPNFHKQQQQKYGLNFDQIVEKMKNTIDKVENGNNYNKILVGHDWGAYVTYLFDAKYPKFVDRLLCLDVSPHFEATFKSVLFTILYQWWNIWAFLLGLVYEPLGNMLTKLLIVTLFSSYPYDKGRINCTMGYMYFYLWVDLFRTLLFKKKNKLSGYTPSQPFIYIYGKNKPFHFHNERWFNKIKKNSENQIHGVDSGHWIQYKHSQFLADLIQKRIQDLQK